MYHAKLGRWLTRDPLGDPGFEIGSEDNGERASGDLRQNQVGNLQLKKMLGVERAKGPNLYAYVRNGPINAVDLLGLFDPVKDAEKLWTRVAIPLILADLGIIACVCWNLKRGYGGTLNTPGSIIATLTPIGLSAGQAACGGPFRIELLIWKEQNSEQCHFNYVIVCLGVEA
jgi:hypothetical protein